MFHIRYNGIWKTTIKIFQQQLVSRETSYEYSIYFCVDVVEILMDSIFLETESQIFVFKSILFILHDIEMK